MATSIEQPGLGQDDSNHPPLEHSNGNGLAEPQYLSAILECLQTMRDGDFSVRLPVPGPDLPEKSPTLSMRLSAANQQMAQELKRVGQAVGKEGRTRERTRFDESRGAWGEMEVSVNTLVEDLLRPTSGSDARDRRRGPGQSDPNGPAGRGRAAAGRRIPALGQHRQHHDPAARRLHRGSDARGARSGHRRQAGRPGARCPAWPAPGRT